DDRICDCHTLTQKQVGSLIDRLNQSSIRGPSCLAFHGESLANCQRARQKHELLSCRKLVQPRTLRQPDGNFLPVEFVKSSIAVIQLFDSYYVRVFPVRHFIRQPRSLCFSYFALEDQCRADNGFAQSPVSTASAAGEQRVNEPENK